MSTKGCDNFTTVERREKTKAGCGPGMLVAGAWLLLNWCGHAPAEDFAARCADRAAVERVYYAHQLGDKPSFEQAVPPSLIERLVRTDLHKQTVLEQVYGVAITPGMLETEVQRINATTRAPETLAELKAALGNDTNRFAWTVAQPILVERLLHARFDNDDALHAAQRRETESVRARLLAAKKEGATVTNLLALLKQGHAHEVSEAAWQLGPRPSETNAPSADEIEVRKRFGPNAQVLSPSQRGDGARKFFFEELPPDLQRVLQVQLREAGDVSAVIEAPNGFMLYLCTAKSADALDVSVLALHKRDYDEWLKQQGENTR